MSINQRTICVAYKEGTYIKQYDIEDVIKPCISKAVFFFYQIRDDKTRSAS